MGSGNQITELDLSNCPNLYHLDIFANHLTFLDLSNNTVEAKPTPKMMVFKPRNE